MSTAPDAPRVTRLVASAAEADGLIAASQQYLSSNGVFSSGFWSSEPIRRDIAYKMDELCVILEGHVRLTDAAGHTESYRAGDVFVIPAGFTGVWESVEPTRKFYAIHKPEA